MNVKVVVSGFTKNELPLSSSRVELFVSFAQEVLSSFFVFTAPSHVGLWLLASVTVPDNECRAMVVMLNTMSLACAGVIESAVRFVAVLWLPKLVWPPSKTEDVFKAFFTDAKAISVPGYCGVEFHVGVNVVVGTQLAPYP